MALAVPLCGGGGGQVVWGLGGGYKFVGSAAWGRSGGGGGADGCVWLEWGVRRDEGGVGMWCMVVDRIEESCGVVMFFVCPGEVWQSAQGGAESARMRGGCKTRVGKSSHTLRPCANSADGRGAKSGGR